MIFLQSDVDEYEKMFGKRLDDNFRLLRELKIIEELGFPVLIGPSRKSFIGLTLNLPVDQRIEGTAAAVTAGILNGARIVRVHDVKEIKQVVLSYGHLMRMRKTLILFD